MTSVRGGKGYSHDEGHPAPLDASIKQDINNKQYLYSLSQLEAYLFIIYMVIMSAIIKH